MPVYNESQKSGIVTTPGLPGFSSTTPTGGQPTTVAGSTISLNDLVDVDTSGGRAYQVLFRRTDGTYALKTLGYGTIGGSFPTSGDLIAAYPSGNGLVSYVVGDNLWVWDSTQWVDVGTFRGEPGVSGQDGQDGSGIVVKGTAPWSAISLESPASGDMWILSATEVGVGLAGDGLVWSGTQWINAGAIRGPQGVQGIQGIQGLKGDTGDQGIQGIQGVKGDKGDTGDQGIQGIQGLKGDTGNQGIQGLKGDKGDKGDTGNQGIQGIQGIQGLKGDTGDTGATGAASTVAGPQGIPGTAGADGKTILYGNTNPSSGLGANGDFYINTNTNFLFGPKAAGTWPSGTSLVGPQGIQGVQGIQGTTGSQGIQGPAGTNGIDGKTLRYGAGAPSNGLGADGEFYINTTTNFIHGPKATTWPAGVSLVGPQGIQGIQGIQGVKGDTGDTGPQGIQGVKGDTGDAGPQGIQGIKGDTGDQGIQGIQGIKGDTGDAGPQGIQGVKGDTGDQGIQGIQGVQGVKGDTGDAGAQGIQGIKGDTGDQGIQGIQGDPGTNGTNGTNGATTAQFGGIGTLSSKTYDARLPMPDNFTLTRVVYAGVAGSDSFNVQLVKDGTNFGSPMTVTAGVTYQAFTISLAGTAGSIIQIAASSVTGTAPTKVTFRLDWTTP